MPMKFSLILFAAVSLESDCKNKHFWHILLLHFRKAKKTAEAHEEIHGV